MNFEFNASSPQENETTPQNMDALLDQLNDLDEDAPDFAEQKQALLDKMSALKKENEDGNEAVIEEIQTKREGELKTSSEQVREAADLFHKMNDLQKKLNEGLNTKGMFGMTRFSLREKVTLREEIKAMHDRGIKSYTDLEKPRPEKIGELQGVIDDLEKFAEELDIKI